MGPNKYVHLMFVSGTLLVAFLLSKAGDWAWSYFAKPEETIVNGAALLLSAVIGTVAYRNQRVHVVATEVTRELEKVTWPTRKETSAATVVVIVTVAISALVLTVFDYVWSRLAGLLLMK
jgi:preprotein translocase subunit SecE